MADTNSLDSQWVEIFRAGNYGEKGVYTESDLDQIVSACDPKFHEAPIVVGHPETNSPPYGGVDRLMRKGGTLLAKLRQVEPHFAQMVRDGRFKKRSVALYETAKGLMLRHVGFLGAQPPEVKGLADPVFHNENNKLVIFEEAIVADTATQFDQKSFFENLGAA
jgi:hypothetical protein